jgi:integrase
MLEVLTTEQVIAIADMIEPRYRALVLAAAGLGLRPGEVFGLAVDRVDFLRRTVKVDQQVARGDAVAELAELKTAASYRTVPLPQIVADELAAHLKQFAAHPGHHVIFTTSRGGLVQQHPFAEVWATARKKVSGTEWATPHDLRHYYASTLIRSGASVKVVQARLGHSSAKTTLDTYAHLFPDEEDRTREAVDAAFAAPAASPRPAKVG